MVYLYNIIRFPLFNNDFDALEHYLAAYLDLKNNALNLNDYNGFPGIYVLIIYISRATGIELYTIIKWFPLVTGCMSTLALIILYSFVAKLDTRFGQARDVKDLYQRVTILGVLISTTISLFSLNSSGIFWGQMLTASFIPLVLIKHLQINSSSAPNGDLVEFMMLVMSMFLIHPLTCFLLVTYLSFMQGYLIVNQKATIKGSLVVAIMIVLFLLRFETSAVSISIVAYLTQDQADYFYLYFVALFSIFCIFYVLKTLILQLKNRSGFGSKFARFKILHFKTLLGASAFGILSVAFLVKVLPFITLQQTGLSGSWLFYYGSNLLLLAPLAAVGLLAFGNLFKKSPIKIIIYGWFLTSVIVLVLLLGLYLAGFNVGPLEFGRMATFLYPSLAFFSGFSAMLVGPHLVRVKSRLGTALKHPWLRRTIPVAILAGFVILMPISVIGVIPPPSSTLTRYWNTESELTMATWSTTHALNYTTVNVDYHLQEMLDFYGVEAGKNLTVESFLYFISLDNATDAAMLDPNQSYLIVFDDVMLHYSYSYSQGNVEQGTVPPVSASLLSIYDNLTWMDKVYDSGSQWIYSA
jgi:hypothetical protein